MYVAAWAGGAPGNYESAGKRPSGKTRKGHKAVFHVVPQACTSDRPGSLSAPRIGARWPRKPVEQLRLGQVAVSTGILAEGGGHGGGGTPGGGVGGF
jgi:hypothetical protein